MWGNERRNCKQIHPDSWLSITPFSSTRLDKVKNLQPVLQAGALGGSDVTSGDVELAGRSRRPAAFVLDFFLIVATLLTGWVTWYLFVAGDG